MLDGFDIMVTQKGHVFTVSGKDVEKLWKKLRTTPDVGSRFITGKLPGRPMQTGHVCVFGGAPNFVLQPQKSFVSVSSWTWVSRPTMRS